MKKLKVKKLLKLLTIHHQMILLFLFQTKELMKMLLKLAMMMKIKTKQLQEKTKDCEKSNHE